MPALTHSSGYTQTWIGSADRHDRISLSTIAFHARKSEKRSLCCCCLHF
ncbi:MAG: hypothetical protein HC865_16550 [Cyanobacteria bacterium RU_5_0]|nr:hypothetical protein [Cyanobacteria bacterium RU_5_0]